MFVSLLLGFIRWPQILMIVGLIVVFIVVMGIPKHVKEIVTPKRDFEDASKDEETE